MFGSGPAKCKTAHEEIYPLHAVLGNHLINTDRHGLKFDYVMCNSMHEWTQVLNLQFLYPAINTVCILPSNYKGQNSVSSETSLLLDHNLI